MKYEISNEYLKVKADTEGAILWSVTDKDGFEYIWQGDDRYWNEHGANLFPILPDYGRNPTYFRGRLIIWTFTVLPRILFSPVRKQGRMNWCL